MSLFVEVNSAEKNCPVIVNLDAVVEIAPLVTGGCVIFFADSAGMNSRTGMKVSNEYSEFKQFVMQTVSADDIAKRFPKVQSETPKEEKPVKMEKFKIPKL
jgi:hypothetical protein